MNPHPPLSKIYAQILKPSGRIWAHPPGTQGFSRGVAVELCGQLAWLPIPKQVEEGAVLE